MSALLNVAAAVVWPVLSAAAPTGRRDRSPDPDVVPGSGALPGSGTLPDPAGVFASMTWGEVVALVAAVAGCALLAWWLWWRRDHRGWASGTELGRYLSVDALRRAAPQVRPAMAAPGAVSRAVARVRPTRPAHPVAAEPAAVPACPAGDEESSR